MSNWIRSEIIVGAIGVALSLLGAVGATGVVVAIDPLTAILVVLLLIKEGREEKRRQNGRTTDTEK